MNGSEKATFGFRKMKSVPLAVAEQGLFARSCSTDIAQNHFPARNGLSRAEMDELEQWLGPQAWKLDPALDVLAVELFCRSRALEKCAAHHAEISVCLGLITDRIWQRQCTSIDPKLASVPATHPVPCGMAMFFILPVSEDSHCPRSRGTGPDNAEAKTRPKASRAVLHLLEKTHNKA